MSPPSRTHAFAKISKYSTPGREVYIGNMYAYEQLKKIHPTILSICSYNCDHRDPQVIPNEFFDSAPGTHQSSVDAINAIVRGADYIAKAHEVGPLLSHCHQGCNRSAAMLADYAILFLGEAPEDAIETLRLANRNLRHNFPALTNSSFVNILRNLKPRMQPVTNFRMYDNNVALPLRVTIRPEIWNSLPTAKLLAMVAL